MSITSTAWTSEYWVRAAKITGFWYQPGATATYRLHDRSKTIANHDRFYHDWLAILDGFFARLRYGVPI